MEALTSGSLNVLSKYRGRPKRNEKHEFQTPFKVVIQISPSLEIFQDGKGEFLGE